MNILYNKCSQGQIIELTLFSNGRYKLSSIIPPVLNTAYHLYCIISCEIYLHRDTEREKEIFQWGDSRSDWCN